MEKKKVLKIVLAIIILALIVFAIIITRKYVIISQIVDKQEEIDVGVNYSYKATITSGDKQTIIEIKHKDGKYINDELMLNVWYDSDTEEMIMFNTDEHVASITNNNNYKTFYRVPLIINNTFSSKLYETFNYKISTEEVNGEKCYVLRQGASEYYYKVEDKTMVKCINPSGDKFEYTWEFNNLSDEDVAKPNLEGYNVTQ